MLDSRTYRPAVFLRAMLLAVLVFAGLAASAQQPANERDQSRATKIIRAVEDTIGIEIENLGAEDIKDLEKRALELKNVSVSDRLKSGSGDGGNQPSNQQGNKELLDEVKEATEKVEKLVETASEQLRESAPDVDIFGFDYVQEREVKLFNSALDVKPPDNYIIGAGDEINVNIWGYSDYNEVFVVEKEGYIQPRFVGRVYVKGLRVDDARKVLLSKFDQIYDLRNSKFDITINYSRVITVNVVGEVLNPGSYTLPAINSAFNILAFVGGPSAIGSLRNIQIKRNGEVIDRFDLYRYLFHPERQNDIFLQNNDYLFVPLAQKIVEITGDVKRPGKYELLESETFEDLLEFAAGFTPTSYTKSIQVRRYDNNAVFIFDVDVDSLRRVGGVLPLKNGDLIRVRSIPERIDNILKITGPVKLPGQYEFREGMRVNDLVREAGGFQEEVYKKEAYLTRTREDFTKYTIKLDVAGILNNPGGEADLLLQKRDEVEFFSQDYFYDPYGVTIFGAVRNPRSFRLQQGMSIRDLIMLAGGLEQFAYLDRAYISRRNPEDNTWSYYAFKVDTSNNMAALDEYLIQPYDQVAIMSNLDFSRDNRVSIKGAIRNPGTYELWRDLSLKDVILIAGGLTEAAYLQRAYIYRKYDNLDEEIIPVELDTANGMLALEQLKLQRNDEIEIFSKNSYYESFPVEVAGAVRDPGLFLYRNNMTLADALILGGGLKFGASNHRVEVARVANFRESVEEDVPLRIEIIQLDISVDLARDNVANGFLLEPFDQVYVRETPGFDFQEKVYISGEVKYPGTYVLRDKNEQLESLIRRAGGLTEYAFADGATLVREEDRLGKVLVDLEKALRRPKSKFNYILKEGDVVTVPRQKDLVTISGKIAYPYIDADSLVNVAHTPGKRARYYIRNYGTGFTKQSKRRDTYVVYANGLVKDTRSLVGFKIYPKVERGASIYVPEKVKKQRRDRSQPRERRFDPLTFLNTVFATTTSGVTLYLLVDRALE